MEEIDIYIPDEIIECILSYLSAPKARRVCRKWNDISLRLLPSTISKVENRYLSLVDASYEEAWDDVTLLFSYSGWRNNTKDTAINAAIGGKCRVVEMCIQSGARLYLPLISMTAMSHGRWNIVEMLREYEM